MPWHRFSCFIVLMGCPSVVPEPEPDTDDTAANETEDIWTCSEVSVESTCPGNAPVLSDTLTLETEVSWSVTCNAAIAEPLYVRLPEALDAVHLTVAHTGLRTGMELGLDGEPLVTSLTWDTPPYRVLPGHGSSALLPNHPGATVDGCLAILPMVLDRSAGPTVTISLQGQSGIPASPTLRVQPFRLSGVSLSHEAIVNIVGRTQEILTDEAGLTLQIAEPIDLTRAADIAEADIPGLFESSGEVPHQGVPVFFVNRLGVLLLGRAGGIPGALVPGTGSSGVAIATVGSNPGPEVLARTLAHELGHYLGLFHLSEPQGPPHDVLADTPECTPEDDANGDGRVAEDECPSGATDNLMFHTLLPNRASTELTPDQRHVLRHNPALF